MMTVAAEQAPLIVEHNRESEAVFPLLPKSTDDVQVISLTWYPYL